jgi:endonuclease/exonuclease/phosphatase family metal-dependent hydrolase
LDYNQFNADDNLPTAKKYYTSDGQLQILTWNIHHGLDWLMRPTLDDMAHYLLIAHSHADVICLQEVDTAHIFIPGVGLVNQAIYLTTQLGYYCYYHNNLAILSKAPIVQELEPLEIKPSAVDSNRFASQIISCIIRVNDTDIRVYNCHLPNDISGFLQWHGITNTHNGLLARILDDTYNRHPVIITGDFNSIELFAGIRTLKKITTNSTSQHPSYPVILPLMQLDYILTNGEWVDGLQIQSSAADYNCNLSDHYPIEAIITLPDMADKS